MRKNRKWIVATTLFVCFLAVLLCVMFLDVRAIGPQGSSIGLAGVNAAIRDLFGVKMIWYDITDLLGFIAIAVALGFACLGLCQAVKRRSLKKVDGDILLLGGFYAVVLGVYIFFEIFVVNYRPILMEGELEASFPSSHTMLTVCILGTAMYQFAKRLKTCLVRNCAVVASGLIMAVTVVGRLISGAHWFSDVLAGLFLSCALVFVYLWLCERMKK